MSKYIDAERLKAEVERIRQDWLGDSTGLEVGEIDAAFEVAESILDSIDDIIDSLHQEQQEVVLDDDFVFDEIMSIYDSHNCLPPRDEESLEMLEKVARHFYKLRLNVKEK